MADARTTRGLIGTADSRTTAGLIFGVVKAIFYGRKISWYTLNSEYDVVKALNLSRYITESVSSNLPLSRRILGSVSASLAVSRNIWGYIISSLGLSRNIWGNIVANLPVSRMIYDNLSGKISYTFKAAKRVREYFGGGDVSGDKKKSRMR